MRDKYKTQNHVRVEISPTLDLKKKEPQERTDSSPTRSKKLLEPSQKFDRPTPLDFDAFVPWVCLEWQSPVNVVVTRTIKEEYLKQEYRRGSSFCSKSTKSLKSKDEKSRVTVTNKNAGPCKTSGLQEFFKTSEPDQTVPVTAHYDNRGQLVEISIVNCKEIHRKVIQAISICIPFHSLLTKLTIRKGGVTSLLLNEISKLLPHSNLTDICLDDCVLPEGNYDAIFQNTSQLKSLSLNRCGINDTMCNDLAAKIDFGAPGSSLLILELGSNMISDNGAKAIGESMRRNRSLLHLNLSGNMITDDGALSILVHFMEFPLTRNEIFQGKQRKLQYTENKVAVYERFYEEVLKRQRAEMIADSSSTRKSIKSKKIKKSKNISSILLEEKTVAEIAETMTFDIVGKFSDPFNDDNVVKRERFYSKGNLILCSLNLAYNNLTFMSIKMINDVLKYQDQVAKPLGSLGLMRVVFNGNYIPASCVEYDRIEMFLKKVVTENAPVLAPSNLYKKRTISAPASRKSKVPSS